MKATATKAVFATVVAGVCASTGPLHAQQPDFNAIDSAVQREFERGHFPGGALVIVHQNRVAHVRGFGIADPSGRPVTPQTPFYLGSTTKSITALAVLQLVREGKIDLDAPVQRYLPWFALADSAVSRTITVKDLLLHRGGIPGRAGEYFLADTDTSPAAAERHVRWLANQKPVKGFSYSNLGFTTLGLIVESVTGQPYAAYLKDHVFTPLGMSHTHTERAEAERDGLAAGYAIRLAFAVPYRQPADRGDLAAGYLMSSAEDIGQYLLAQVNAGRVPGHPGVSAEAIADMHVSRRPIVSDRDIAYGFSITQLEGVRILDISGSVPAYCSRFVIAPDSGWGVAILANANGAIAEDHVMEAALNAARMTMGKAPVPVSPQPIVLVIVGLVLMLPVIQLLFAVRTLRRFTRRGRELAHHPKKVRIALPAVGLALWGLFLLAGSPFAFQSYWPTMITYQPDFAWALLTTGAIALTWAVIRTWIAVRVARSVASPAQ